MSTLETSKRRATRIPLNYFKQRNLWERRKLLFALLVAGAACVWWTSGKLLGHHAALDSPGPVAAVHATWNNDCNACHLVNQPANIMSLAGHLRRDVHATDQKCMTCHAGTAHVPTQVANEVPSCASCHREHEGVNASLVRVADATCTRCHGAMDQQHFKPDVVPSDHAKVANVTRFDIDHPKFKSAPAQKVLRQIRFSHYVHMMPGVHVNGKDDRDPWKLADIPDKSQIERYRAKGQKDNDLVQLDCNSCHQLDGGDFTSIQLANLPRSTLPDRAAGAYMIPITYENQCQACHFPEMEYEKGNKATTLVHRQSAEQMRLAIENFYTAELLRKNASTLDKRFPPATVKDALAAQLFPDNPKLLDQFIPDLKADPLPDRSLLPSAMSVREQIKSKVAEAEQALMPPDTRKLDIPNSGCGKCHIPEASDRTGLRDLEPSKIPSVWLPKAKFDHRAHRAVECRACHAGPNLDDPNLSTRTSETLIPKIDVCLKCHSPRDESNLERPGGARFDCIECHRYHNGAAPLAGLGAKIEGPSQKMSVRQFENGAKQDQ